MSPPAGQRWRRPGALVLAGLTLAYPLIVYLGLQRFEPRMLAVVLFLIAATRALATPQPIWLAAATGIGLLALAATLGNAVLPLKLYPVLVNAVLCAVFLVSLWRPPSAIERLARLREPDLPPRAVRYTRRVTWVWAGFFVLNGSIALATALWASDAVWSLYNGLVAYGLIGLVFGIEWLVRQRVRALPDE